MAASNAGKALLGVLAGDGEHFDWQDDNHRLRHEAGTVIYELHVGGFTSNPKAGVKDEKRGMFAGLIEKTPYLKDLGITVVELMPVFQYDPSDGNYWGYMPLNFFSPHHGYLSDIASDPNLAHLRLIAEPWDAAGVYHLGRAFPRTMACQWYGGGPEVRLMQALVLGIGGWRLLAALGIEPEVCHLNEGHAALAVLERARSFMQATGQPFEVALAATRAGNLFTTHTAVAASFDRFAPARIEHWLGGYARTQLGITPHELLALGRRNPDDASEPFNMTYLAIRGSGAVNGVSQLHGEVSRHLFDPNVLTLGFARRFATYKRPDLLLHDPERLLRLLTDPQRPVQLIMAGKAHPADKAGWALIQQWMHFIRRPETYTPDVGWALGDGQEHDDDSAWDAMEAEALYDLLENEVIPAFYTRDEQGIPSAWVARMRESMARLTPRFFFQPHGA